MKKSTRIGIAQQTLEAIEQGFYVNALGEKITIAEDVHQAVASTELWKEQDFASHLASQTPDAAFTTQFEVNNETTLDACQRLVAQYGAVFCLNFASAKNSGGGFLGGAQAQEESLARSSALYPCLHRFQNEFYDYHRKQKDLHYSDRMIYSPKVPVFRNDDGDWLVKPYSVSFLTSPAVNVGALQSKKMYKPSIADALMLQRTEKLLTLAYHKGYRALVLGAWGCGVFRNDASKVADYFADWLLNEGRFAHCF
jgi:uncharacterized protein (TIGR02452 family)